MAILTRLRFLRRLARPTRTFAVRAGLVAALALIEGFGRGSASDFADLIWLGFLTFVLTAWLGMDPGARVAILRLFERLGPVLERRTPAFGVDLRGEPVVPRGVPSFVRGIAVTCLMLTAAELVWILLVGTPFRAFAASGSYVLLLVVTAVLWTALLFTLFAAAILVFLVVQDGLRYRYGDRPHARRRRAWVVGYLLAAVLGILFLPEWVAVVALVSGLVLFAVAETLVRLPRLTLLWRDRDGRVGAFGWYQWINAQVVLLSWPVGILVVGGLGGRAFGAPAGDTTPITDALAVGAAWFAGPASLIVTLFSLDLLHIVLRRDPAADCATTVHVTSAAPPADERRAGELLAARGWRVRWHPEAPERADVRLRLVERMPRSPDGHGRWPLAVSANALEAPELLDLIARRDLVQRRRLLLRGLERMLKRGRQRKYAAGTGFWIAPQHWFVIGLTRDTDEGDQPEGAMIGEPYHIVMPAAARRYAYEVFRGVEVDIVFVEDGVTWSNLRRILRRVFQHYDAGHGRVEDRHLTGVTGVRVIVHDFRIGEPLGREKYPEPDYEDLGRARVLHVFKDRGGEEEPEPAPSTDDHVPVGV